MELNSLENQILLDAFQQYTITLDPNVFVRCSNGDEFINILSSLECLEGYGYVSLPDSLKKEYIFPSPILKFALTEKALDLFATQYGM